MSDSYVGNCPNCRSSLMAPAGQDPILCNACGRSVYRAQLQSSTPTAFSPKKRPGEVTVLKVLSLLNLIGGGLAALACWAGNTTREDSKYLGMLGLSFLAAGIAGAALLSAVALIVESLINIENGIAWQNWRTWNTASAAPSQAAKAGGESLVTPAR